MNQDAVREQLLKLLDGSQAHITLEKTVETFPEDRVNARVDGVPYSAWRIVEHMRLAQRDILDYVAADDYQELEFPAGYWPPDGKQASEAEWRDTIARFIADQEALKAIARDPQTDLTAPLPRNSKHTILRQLLIAGSHNSYHLGQLFVLKRAFTA